MFTIRAPARTQSVIACARSRGSVLAGLCAVTSGLCTPVVKSRTLALAEGGSLAYLAVQRLEAPESGFRAGAIGHGPDGARLAERLCRHIDTWGADRTARPSITIYPHSATQTAGAQVIRREHCEMTVAY
jgi:protein-L-isoaspartate(D-aspartate) O-methyltransferase